MVTYEQVNRRFHVFATLFFFFAVAAMVAAMRANIALELIFAASAAFWWLHAHQYISLRERMENQ